MPDTPDRTARRATPETGSDVVGLITLGIGAALALAPRRSGTALGLGDDRALARSVGLADLVIGAGLLHQRPRWPWMTARAGLNLVLVGLYRRQAGRGGGHPCAQAGASRMALATVVDGSLAAVLAHREH